MIFIYMIYLAGFLLTLPEKVFCDQNERWHNRTLPFLSVLKYRKLKRNVTDINETHGTSTACHHETRVHHEVMDDKGVPMIGKFIKVTFSHLEIAKLAALDNYDSDVKTIPVNFHTKWRSNNNSGYEELVHSLLKDTVVNISFTSTINVDDKSYCSGENHVSLDIAWCKWAQIFRHHGLKGLPRFDENGQCVVNRSDEAQHYLNMWYTGDSKEFQGKCVGTDRDACPRTSLQWNTSDSTSTTTTSTAPTCLHKMFMANGKGVVTKLQVGKSTYHPHFNITDQEYIDINMTVSFGKWSADFPELFTKSYKHCLYHGNVSEITLDLFALDKIERAVPMQFFAFMVVAAVLGIVVLIALTLVVCTCSTKGFRMELWEFWEKRNAYRKYAKEHASEIAEQAADKRMEKQEAMMSSMMGD